MNIYLTPEKYQQKSYLKKIFKTGGIIIIIKNVKFKAYLGVRKNKIQTWFKGCENILQTYRYPVATYPFPPTVLNQLKLCVGFIIDLVNSVVLAKK